ncbi:unnamed protein product [Rotaria socialis]|uniref:Uncharacterized protein n=1 Tax=Rotaria socialis TaxID=392032 RepID=A0A820PLG3_9BILA|nr:unnamed protein product [Rotaria socialis]
MPRLFNGGFPIEIDSYADAILRTFASLKSPSAIIFVTSRKNGYFDPVRSTVINSSLDDNSQSISNDTSSSSINEKQLTFDQPGKKSQRLTSHFNKIYINKNNKIKMSTKTLLPSSSHINDRYYFCSPSTMNKKSKHKSDTTPPSLRKRYKFSSVNGDQYRNKNIYKFPANQSEPRSYSTDCNRYYFPLDNSIKPSRKTLPHARSRSGLEQRSVTFMEGTSTYLCDTPYTFSKTSDTLKYPSTASTLVRSEVASPYQFNRSKKIVDGFTDSSLHSVSLGPEFRKPRRLDTVTSTNGSLSKIKRSRTDKTPSVRFESIPPPPPSYLNEARVLLSEKRRNQSPESFEKSVDRLVLSVNQKYRQQQQQQPMKLLSSNSSSLNYISQYYAKEDKPFSDDSLEIGDEQKRLHSSFNTNRTHTQIIKNLNKSLIDRNYQIDKNRLIYFEQNVRRYLRSYENQTLQRELNYDLIRCFSTSYLDDLKRDGARHAHTRNQMRSYTYEDIQDIHVPSILEAYKMKATIGREKQHRIQQSSMTTGQLSPVSSSGFSPLMVASFNENIDTQSTGFETDRKSYTSISQPLTTARPDVDLFYKIMQESFVGIDASIAGHVARATQCKREKSHQNSKKTSNTDTDLDIQTFSSLWSDDDDEQLADHFYIDKTAQRKGSSHHRKLSRYLSTVNRSLLDRPGDLIADFYLSQLNRNMQESVRHVESIAQAKARKQGFIFDRSKTIERSLSAEHLYQVRKEHIRYKQSFKTPTSFTTEDVSDIYKPFVLENYKRKIAIELERRRRARQEQLTIDICSLPMCNSEIDLSTNVIKSTHPPIIDFDRPSPLRHDFLVVSPSNIIQTKEIIMGRARRTIIDDGSTDVVQHVGIIAPPQIYSILTSSASKVNNLNEVPILTTVDPPDFADRKKRPRQQDQSDGLIDSVLQTSQQAISSDLPMINATRPKTKIYTYISPSHAHKICQAKYVESEPVEKKLSTITIKPIVTLNQHEVKHFNELLHQTERLPSPRYNYQYALPAVSSPRALSSADQSEVEEFTQYTLEERRYEPGNFTIPFDEEMPIYENISAKYLPVVPDIGVSRSIGQRKEKPLNPLTEQHVTIDEVLLNEQVQDMNEPLPEYEQVNVKNEVSNVNTFLESLVVELVYNFDPLASLLEDLNYTAHKQYAKQIIDDDNYCNVCEKAQETIRIPIMVDNTEWTDEHVQIISNQFDFNIENAQHKDSENIEYECVKVNLPEQFINSQIPNTSNSDICDLEQAVSLADDSLLVRHQERANINIDESSCLKNSINSTHVFELNYALYNNKKSHKKTEDELLWNRMEKMSIDSEVSSFADMETFLNSFEQSLDHEQHLPIIDQMSYSYVTTKTERCKQKHRLLPIEWFRSTTVQSHDEQLVEQWTVEKDIDTIQHEGTLRRQQIELITNTECVNLLVNASTNNACSIDKKFNAVKSNNSTPAATHENNDVRDILTHRSSTIDYEQDSLDKDNNTVNSTMNNAFIIPLSSNKNILPSSSITNTTQSLSPLTFYSAPTIPVIYLLDALATEQKHQTNNPTRNFLFTIGFGLNEINNTMTEITNTVSAADQALLPTWINRSLGYVDVLPTIIHHENESTLSSIEQEIHFPTENQLDEDDTAHLIYPHHLQYGHDLYENTQGPLKISFESSHMHLPIINEVYIYQMSFHCAFPLFHPPNVLPHVLPFTTQDDGLISPKKYQIKQQEVLSYVRTRDLFDNEENIVQTISCKLDQPSYIDHYHIQSLFPFPETCYADIFQPDILIKSENNLLSSIFSRKLNIIIEDEHDFYQLDQAMLMQEKAASKQKEREHSQLKRTASLEEMVLKPLVYSYIDEIF